MVKIIEKHNRGVLGEGRNNGMAFAFLQKMPKDEYWTVQPASPCKDYLAEVVFTEKYGIPTKACGLHYKQKLDIFTDVAYMAIKMVKTHGSNGYYNYSSDIETDIKTLEENHKEIERLINLFEKRMKMKVLTEITKANDGYFLLKFSSEWCKSTVAISLYTLLIRCLMVATKKDKDIMAFIQSYSYNAGDKNLLTSAMAKIKLIWDKQMLPPNTRQYSRKNLEKYIGSPHNNGILSWDSQFKEVKLGD